MPVSMSSMNSRTSQRVRQSSAYGLLLLCSLLLAACQQSQVRTPATNEQELKSKLAPLDIPEDNWSRRALQEPVRIELQEGKSATDGRTAAKKKSAAASSDDIWERLRNGFRILEQTADHPRIDQHRLWYTSRKNHIEITAKRSAPYLHYIVDALDQRNMPLELALLPAIESSYNPLAQSPSQAAGLWQFIPSTGRNFKLKQTQWYDGRRDVTASTHAALDYLQYLNKMFNGDWLLTLAAYNAGEGTVSRAIKRNQQLGLPTDYWNLQLSKQAQAYVPKLLALAQLIASPNAYALKLPDIPDRPYFARVPLKHQLGLQQIADMAKVSSEHIHALNPAYKQGVTLDGPAHILVPAEHAPRLQRKLAELKPGQLPMAHSYVVRSGDTLSHIARRNGTTVATIRQLNQLKSTRLRVGQRLSLPGGQPPATLPASIASAGTSEHYLVRSGDSLSVIAKRHGVSMQQIKQWNNLSGNQLRVGQKLRVKPGSTQYVVRAGDSLSSIARRHKVSVKQLQSWNPAQGTLIKPGQKLTLHL